MKFILPGGVRCQVAGLAETIINSFLAEVDAVTEFGNKVGRRCIVLFLLEGWIRKFVI